MNSLSIGLVSSSQDESVGFVKLLERYGVDIKYHLEPSTIQSCHIEDAKLNVWLLNIDEDAWHDNVDLLLDGTDVTIFFHELDNSIDSSDLPRWCQNLAKKLHQLVDIPYSPPIEKVPDIVIESINKPIVVDQTHQVKEEIDDNLSLALDELESSSLDIPAEIAEDLVSELESISPELETHLDDDFIADVDATDFDHLVDDEEQMLDTDLASELAVNRVAEDEHSPLHPHAETAEISHEILDLASGETDKKVASLSRTTQLDEIDFSESSISMLLESIEDCDDVEQSLSTSLPEATAVVPVPRADAPVKISELEEMSQAMAGIQLDDLADVTTESESDATVDLNIRSENDESIELTDELQRVDPLAIVDPLDVIDEAPPLDEIPILDSNLSLEAMEEDRVTGKAVYTEEQAESQSLEKVIADEPQDDRRNERQDDRPDDLSGFSLEEIDLSVSEKAVFLEMETALTQQEEMPTIAIEERLPETGLTLEMDEESAIDGIAQFKIDDPNEALTTISAKQQAKTDEPQEELAQFDTGGLALESMEDDLEAVDELDADDEAIPELNEALEADEVEQLQLEDEIPLLSMEHQESKGKASFEASEFIEDFSEDEINFDLVEQQLAGIEPASEPAQASLAEASLVEEPQECEIPMLEDAATDVAFEPLAVPQGPNLTPCWVIGASLGGPAAVKRFLQAIPRTINASFIIVQHIDEKFLPVLAEILTNNSHFEVKVANGSNQLGAGDVFLAPLKGKLIFLQDGSMLVDYSQKWTPPYAPCIDDVISSLSKVYKNDAGAIIFSGMGEDGLTGAREMLALDGKVWAQSVDTCANSSMPEAIINEQLASVIASPDVLAERLVQLLSVSKD